MTNNVVYKNIDGLSIKGIDAATYNGQASAASTGNLNFNNFYFVTSGALADIFAKTSVTDYADWAEVVSEQPANTGADESTLSWTLWSSINN